MSITEKGDKYVKECAATEKRIKKFLKKWHWIVTDKGWKFDTFYCLRSEDMPENASDNCAGYVTCDWAYLNGDVYFSLGKLRDLNDSELEEIVLHELVHMLIAQGVFEAEVENKERCTTEVTRTLLALSS